MGGTSILLLVPASRVVVAIISNGSQLWLRNAMLRGSMTRQAGQFLFNKDAIAQKIAKTFATLFAKSEQANRLPGGEDGK